jgi:hypothetical protein
LNRAERPASHDIEQFDYGACTMDLTFWIPALMVLGLITMGLMFAFLAACERV